jgi:hypothetical protein
MNAVDLIAREASQLPEALQAEVLDFIGYLKMRHPSPPAVTTSDARLADLMVFFAPYRKDFGGFVFDRDEANAR